MKEFIKKIILFLICVFIIMLLNYFFNISRVNKKPILTSTKLLIAGDSRVMTAINPDLIPNSRNIAQNSESYFLTYHKLKFILPANPQIKSIVMGFSYPSFSAYMDRLYYNDIATTDIFSRFYPIMLPNDFAPLKIDEKKYYQVYFKQMLLLPHLKHEQYLGEFTPLPYGLNKANLENVVKRHYFDKAGKNVGISKISTAYLDSIIKYCNSQKINLTLVNIPFQRDYLKSVPSNFIEFYNSKKLELVGRGIKILDYSKMELDNKYFKDYNHLDIDGANYFSSFIKSDLKSITKN
jgi:hypothetical protein